MMGTLIGIVTSLGFKAKNATKIFTLFIGAVAIIAVGGLGVYAWTQGLTIDKLQAQKTALTEDIEQASRANENLEEEIARLEWQRAKIERMHEREREAAMELRKELEDVRKAVDKAEGGPASPAVRAALDGLRKRGSDTGSAGGAEGGGSAGAEGAEDVPADADADGNGSG